ncbi:MAG: GAF domain-containing sensor histidine kinase [Candidatus Omnitrophota bacterium]
MPSITLNAKEKILNDFLHFTLTKCMNLLEAKSGSIFLFDDKTEELVLKTASNGWCTSPVGIRQTLGEGISGSVALLREPALVKDINTDSRFLEKRRFNHYRTNSFISVPLEFCGELIGVINITEHSSEKPFDKEDLKHLIDLCSFFAFFFYQYKRYSWDSSGNTANQKFFMMGKFSAGLIHELNNPLDGIIRYVNLSLNCLGEESIIKEYLLEAKNGLNRIVKIVRSLLDFGRTTSYNTPGLVDVSKIIEESLFIMNHYFTTGKIAVTKRLDQNLPLIEDHGLKLVFTNILKNACDAIDSEEGQIGIMTESRNGFIDVQISDSGPGIPEDVRNRIFEPFFTTKEMGKGSGLGLAICLSIIEKYKGCILLETEEGRGATFTIRIPVNGGGA